MIRWFYERFFMPGGNMLAGVRGRVHRVSIVQGGEVSVVLRFGVEEAEARGFNQGALVELREIRPVEVQTP